MSLLPPGDQPGEVIMENNAIVPGVVAAVGEEQQQQQPRLRLAPGVRFLPTDEELLTLYLSNRVAGRALPWSFYIPTRDLFVPGADPWVVQREVAFPYGQGSEFYCFSRRTRRGSGALRTAGSGTWAAKGKDAPVLASRTGEVVGHKLMLKFVPKGGVRGLAGCANWVMHEYRLPDQGQSSFPKGKAKQFQELVLCRIYHRREKGASTSSEEASSDATTFFA